MLDNFAYILKALLEEKNHTQKELADYMHVAPTTVSEWCSGKKTPRMSKINRIALFLGVPSSTFFPNENNVPSNVVRITHAWDDLLPLSPEECQHIRHMRGLLPVNRARLFAAAANYFAGDSALVGDMPPQEKSRTGKAM